MKVRTGGTVSWECPRESSRLLSLEAGLFYTAAELSIPAWG